MVATPLPVIEPDINPESKPFWDAANDGLLLVAHCNSCGRPHFYPRRMCPLCGSTDVEWRPASGRATIYSCSVLRRTKTPYAIAWIVLEEEVGMLINIVDCDLDTLAIGQPVEITFVSAESGQHVPMARPANIAK